MKRIISGLLGFPIVAIILIFGNKYVIDIMFSIVAIFCIHEFYQSFKPDSHPVEWVRISVCGVYSFYTYTAKGIFCSSC